VGGDWRGGNQLQVLNPPRQVAIAYLKAQFHLLVGEHAATFGAPEALFLTGLFALALLGFLAARHRARPGTSRDALSEPLNALPAVACVILAYTGGILYASLRATDLDLRLFVPILPFYLALAGIFLVKLEAAWPTGSAQRYGVYAALLLMAAGFAGTNLRDFRTLTPVDHRAQLAALYAKPDSQPLIKWIETYLPPEQTIAAVDGQATGYLLHRPTLALVPAEHSAQRWECESLKAEMKRFGAQYLILYRLPPGIEPDPVMDQSLFLRTAAHERPTCGFSIAQANDHVRILELASGQ
jgi:hypothetical protein